jgi:hypothetical protein
VQVNIDVLCVTVCIVCAAAITKKSPSVKKKLSSQDEDEELHSDSMRGRHALRRVDERLQVRVHAFSSDCNTLEVT